jgi:hypothetical protein
MGQTKLPKDKRMTGEWLGESYGPGYRPVAGNPLFPQHATSAPSPYRTRRLTNPAC